MNEIFSSTFTVSSVPEEKAKRRDARIGCMSGDIALTLDYNSEIYVLDKEDTFELALLPAEATEDDYAEYEYVAHGKVLKRGAKEVIISNGGLLLSLSFPSGGIDSGLSEDDKVFTCIRKSKCGT